MERHTFRHDGLALSFLDDGGKAPPLIALHSHWMEGLTYASPLRWHRTGGSSRRTGVVTVIPTMRRATRATTISATCRRYTPTLGWSRRSYWATRSAIKLVPCCVRLNG
jgi:hypothetical protein